jgi:hypothetical protein
LKPVEKVEYFRLLSLHLKREGRAVHHFSFELADDRGHPVASAMKEDRALKLSRSPDRNVFGRPRR